MICKFIIGITFEYLLAIFVFYGFACNEGFHLKATKLKVIFTIIIAILLALLVILPLAKYM